MHLPPGMLSVPPDSPSPGMHPSERGPFLLGLITFASKAWTVTGADLPEVSPGRFEVMGNPGSRHD